MLEWWARRQVSLPISKFLQSDDFETILGLAFRWCNRDAPVDKPDNIPDEVKQVTYRVIRGFFKKELNLRTPSGLKVSREAAFIFVKDINPWRDVLWRCLSQDDFDFQFLSKLFVERSEVLSWCDSQQIRPPGLWAKVAVKETAGKRLPLESRVKNEDVDRLVCQALARVYWEIDPSIHPAHLATSRAIKKYGNGRLYVDDSTVKGWIAEVDPKKETRKTGRPEKIPYRINLETGCLVD